MRFPEQQFSVIILANRSDANPSEKALQIADIFLKDDYIKNDEVEETKREVTNSIKEEVNIDMDKSSINSENYAGNYYSGELNTTYLLFLENKVLKVKIGNNEPMTLEMYGTDQFNVEDEGLLFQFKRDNGHITGFELDAGRVQNLKFTKE